MTGARRCEIEIDVRYAETDQMQVVHHANYLVWLELARTELCHRSGLHYAEIERRGYYLMVTQVEVKYRRGARYGDRVVMSCGVTRLGSRGISFDYEAVRDGQVVATGRTHHVWVRRDDGKPCRIPDFARRHFEPLVGDS